MQQNGRTRRSGADTRHGSGGSNGRRKSAGGLSGQSESDEEEEEFSESNELTLTKIARFAHSHSIIGFCLKHAFIIFFI